MTAATVVDAICTYFGGPYDAFTHSYRQPQLTVQGVAMGVVRRAKPKRWDNADYYLGAIGVPIGCAMLVTLSPGEESRVGLGGSTAGLKLVRYDVTLDCLLRSEGPYAEDAQDALYALRDAVVAHIRADRTLGSGGIEAGGFQVAEGPPWLRWLDSGVVSSAERTEALLSLRMPADEYVIA